jgi:hypothetical protein
VGNSDDDSAAESYSDTENWLNRTGDFDNVNNEDINGQAED